MFNKKKQFERWFQVFTALGYEIEHIQPQLQKHVKKLFCELKQYLHNVFFSMLIKMNSVVVDLTKVIESGKLVNSAVLAIETNWCQLDPGYPTYCTQTSP